MCDENETVSCCSKYSRPERHCDMYPACEACQHLIADESPPAEEVTQRLEEPVRLTAYDDCPTSEPIRDPLY